MLSELEQEWEQARIEVSGWERGVPYLASSSALSIRYVLVMTDIIDRLEREDLGVLTALSILRIAPRFLLHSILRGFVVLTA